MKKILVVALLALLLFPVFASGSKEATSSAAVAKDSATFVVSGNPYRFFHLTPAACGGDDNIVLANVYDNLLCLENDGSLSNAIAETYTLSEDEIGRASCRERV